MAGHTFLPLPFLPPHFPFWHEWERERKLVAILFSPLLLPAYVGLKPAAEAAAGCAESQECNSHTSHGLAPLSLFSWVMLLFLVPPSGVSSGMPFPPWLASLIYPPFLCCIPLSLNLLSSESMRGWGGGEERERARSWCLSSRDRA